MAATGIADDALAEVLRITELAEKANKKHRWARTAELYGRAAALADAAGAASDSLVVAMLRIRRARVLAAQTAATEESISATEWLALADEAWASACQVARTVCARLDAGTLLPPGALRSDELAFSRSLGQVNVRVYFSDRLGDAAFVQRGLSLLGYEVALLSGDVLLRLFCCQIAKTGADVSAAQDFVLRVLALVVQVRHDFQVPLVSELYLASLLQVVISPKQRAIVRGEKLNERFYDALVAACEAPAFREALRAHGTLSVLASGILEAVEEEGEARSAADVAAHGLRTCALPACGAQEATVQQFKFCGGCKRVAYCCAEHAKAHWKAGHKAACRAASGAS